MNHGVYVSKNLYELVKRYTVRYSSQIKEICSPLQIHLHLSMFAYYSIEINGRFGVVCNYPEEHEFFFSEKLYMACPYLVHPRFFRSGYALIPATKSEQNKNRNEKISHLFLIMRKLPHKVEGFFFSSPQIHLLQLQDLLNQIDLLHSFGLYFKARAGSIIDPMLQDGYNLLEAKGGAFEVRNPLLPLSGKDPSHLHFLNDIAILSPQENRCLELYKAGYCARSTAEVLKISKRTVEHYFESICMKLGCSKIELLRL